MKVQYFFQNYNVSDTHMLIPICSIANVIIVDNVNHTIQSQSIHSEINLYFPIIVIIVHNHEDMIVDFHMFMFINQVFIIIVNHILVIIPINTNFPVVDRDNSVHLVEYVKKLIIYSNLFLHFIYFYQNYYHSSSYRTIFRQLQTRSNFFDPIL